MSPVQRIGQGVSKLSDSNPSNNLEGMRDIAVGVTTTVSITAAMLDQYLQRNNMSLNQLSLPGIGAAMRNSYTNVNSLAAKAVIAGVREATRPDTPEEEKQKQEAAKKKTEQAREEERKARDAQVAAAREAERQRFMRGDNGMQDRDREKEQQNALTQKKSPTISIV